MRYPSLKCWFTEKNLQCMHQNPIHGLTQQAKKWISLSLSLSLSHLSLKGNFEYCNCKRSDKTKHQVGVGFLQRKLPALPFSVLRNGEKQIFWLCLCVFRWQVSVALLVQCECWSQWLLWYPPFLNELGGSLSLSLHFVSTYRKWLNLQ